MIKVNAYEVAGYCCLWLTDQPELGLQWRRKLNTGDFRKELHIRGLWFPSLRIISTSFHGAVGTMKHISGTRLGQSGLAGMEGVTPDEFSDLNATLQKVGFSNIKPVLQLVS